MPLTKSQKVAQSPGWRETLFPLPCDGCGTERRRLYYDAETGYLWCPECLTAAVKADREAAAREHLAAHPDMPWPSEE